MANPLPFRLNGEVAGDVGDGRQCAAVEVAVGRVIWMSGGVLEAGHEASGVVLAGDAEGLAQVVGLLLE
jgi:hypothetical protein